MKKAPTHLRIDAYTFILLMIHFEKLEFDYLLTRFDK